MTGQFMSLPDDVLMHTVEVAHAARTRAEAAQQLGITERTLRARLSQATSRNLTGSYIGPALPAGRQMGVVTVQYDGDGNVQREWQRHLPGDDALETLAEELTLAMRQEVTPIGMIPEPDDESILAGMLTMYPVVDVHLGQFSWGKETGENYDLKIAKTQFKESVTELMQYSPPSMTALIPVLGDFFHADNNDAQTSKSHNHLDVDGRHDKTLHLGVELIIWMIDMALQKHQNIVVHVSRGNHDPMSSKLLATALFFRYESNPRVTIDRSPKDLWTYQWGVNMLSFTHGDNVKASDMPGVMAAFEPEIWGETKYRFGYSGHFHRVKVSFGGDERHGAKWEILPAFTAKDAWNKSMGFSGQRTIVSKTFDHDKGLRFTYEVNV